MQWWNGPGMEGWKGTETMDWHGLDQPRDWNPNGLNARKLEGMINPPGPPAWQRGLPIPLVLPDGSG